MAERAFQSVHPKPGEFGLVIKLHGAQWARLLIYAQGSLYDLLFGRASDGPDFLSDFIEATLEVTQHRQADLLLCIEGWRSSWLRLRRDGDRIVLEILVCERDARLSLADFIELRKNSEPEFSCNVGYKAFGTCVQKEYCDFVRTLGRRRYVKAWGLEPPIDAYRKLKALAEFWYDQEFD